jgi:hypothetical protein
MLAKREFYAGGTGTEFDAGREANDASQYAADVIRCVEMARPPRLK